MSRKFAVIGMGWTGAVTAETLASMGYDVVGIDRDGERVEDLSGSLTKVRLVTGDARRTSVLTSLGIGGFDGAAVTVEGDVQTSMVVTARLKDLGVQHIVVRAIDPLHAEIAERIGADRVIRPEEHAGEMIGHAVASPLLYRYLDLKDGEALAELSVPRNWEGKSLGELDQDESLTVLLLRRNGSRSVPGEGDDLREGDSIVVWGKKEELGKSELFKGEGSSG